MYWAIKYSSWRRISWVTCPCKLCVITPCFSAHALHLKALSLRYCLMLKMLYLDCLIWYSWSSLDISRVSPPFLTEAPIFLTGTWHREIQQMQSSCWGVVTIRESCISKVFQHQATVKVAGISLKKGSGNHQHCSNEVINAHVMCELSLCLETDYKRNMAVAKIDRDTLSISSSI